MYIYTPMHLYICVPQMNYKPIHTSSRQAAIPASLSYSYCGRWIQQQ